MLYALPEEAKDQLKKDKIAIRQQLLNLLDSSINPKELDMYLQVFNHLGYTWHLGEFGKPYVYEVKWRKMFTVGYCIDLLTVVTFCQQYELRKW